MSLEGFESLELVREGDLLRIRLNEPQRANALSPRMVGELTRLYSRPLLDDGIRAMVLEGAGKHFSAGADLAHLRSLLGAGPEENRADSERLRGLFEAVLRRPARWSRGCNLSRPRWCYRHSGARLPSLGSRPRAGPSLTLP